MTTDSDIRWMKQALQVARRGQGNTAENPAVGCVIIDKQENLVGVGSTAAGGRPHAEPQAIEMAGNSARGATAYVTLEPCAHHGKTPPCARHLLDAGLARVVVATTDPDRRVSGKGIEILRAGGVDVVTGVLAEHAEYQLRGFFSRIRQARPHVLLKLAVSADGMIAAKPGSETKITGPLFKQYVHLLRARADAVLVGAGTVRTDNPSLTCRLPGMQHLSPQQVIVGGNVNLQVNDQAWHYTGQVDFAEVLLDVGARGINFLLVEGGAKIARSLLEADLVDEAILATAPGKIGPQGVTALAGMSLAHIAANDRFVLKEQETIGPDVVRKYLRTKRTS
jgi:diaminohydroxyphosphoribosylaminopyrimidine deaminase/5-amino-6-(5-phosphoribosylamino)uracil reductase